MPKGALTSFSSSGPSRTDAHNPDMGPLLSGGINKKALPKLQGALHVTSSFACLMVYHLTLSLLLRRRAAKRIQSECGVKYHMCVISASKQMEHMDIA